MLGAYTGLWVFGVAFGLIEAAVVVYLRDIFDIQDGELFPFLPYPDSIQENALRIERFREAATLLLMLAPAYLFSNRVFEKVVAYGIVFGLWVMSYYGFLWIFLDWPTTLMTYDVLFLIPALWVAPVICPLMISLSLVVFGTSYIIIGRRRVTRIPSAMQFLMAVGGGVLVIWSFVAESDYYMNGGVPPAFSWLIFGPGFFLAAAAGGFFLGQYVQQNRNRFF